MASSSLSAAGKSILQHASSPGNTLNSTHNSLQQTRMTTTTTSPNPSKSNNNNNNNSNDAIEKNPFILPADSDVFRLREEEVLKRDEVSIYYRKNILCVRYHGGIKNTTLPGVRVRKT